MLERVVLGVLLLVHGLIHLAWVAPKPDDPKYPFSPNRSWMADKAPEGSIASAASALAWLATAQFTLAAGCLIALPMIPSLWRVFAAIGALDSLALIALFWHPWFIVGALIDVAIIVIAAIGWPTS